MKNTALISCACAALLASTAHAQVGPPTYQPVAKVLLKQGGLLPGLDPNEIVDFIFDVQVNDNGGFVARVDGASGIYSNHAFGSAAGSSPSLLASHPGGVGSQPVWNESTGISDYGDVCRIEYGGPSSVSNSLWLGDTLVAISGENVPGIPGQAWNTISRLRCTADGGILFRAGIKPPGPFVQTAGLFLVASDLKSLTNLALGGSAVPNLPSPLATTGIGEFEVSKFGSQFIYVAQMSGPVVGTANDSAIVLSGEGLKLGGILVQEGRALATSIGGDGTESWEGFDHLGINGSGDYFFTGDTNGPEFRDELLVLNGAIAYREGDVLDGKRLEGKIKGASLNENGDLAFIWSISDSGGPKDALFLNDSCLLVGGDEVDWNGDGNPGPQKVIDQFARDLSVCHLVLGSDGVAYFLAAVDAPMGTRACLLSLSVNRQYERFCFGDGTGADCPCSLVGGAGEGCLTSTWSGVAATASGDAVVGADSLVLTATNCPPGTVGLFFQGDSELASPGVLGDGLLCLTGNLQRFGVTQADAAGVLVSGSPLSVLGGVSPGDTRYYQAWIRDPQGFCGGGSNTSNGVVVDWY